MLEILRCPKCGYTEKIKYADYKVLKDMNVYFICDCGKKMVCKRNIFKRLKIKIKEIIRRKTKDEKDNSCREL